MAKRALIIGAGVAGCACGYFLSKKGYNVTILEKADFVGGLSRTHYYNGHPYEFGPHIWFWPKDRENNIVQELTNGELYNINRKLYTFTGQGLYRYPIHYNDVLIMPDRDKIFEEWKDVRDDNHQLNSEKLPTFGQCSFQDYFQTAIGQTLYSQFMKNYTHKMWGIPGNELQTTMILADKLKSDKGNSKYDPIKFKEQHYLGEGMPNWYPKKGWNVVWEKMIENCTVVFNVKDAKLSEEFSAVTATINSNKVMFSLRDYEAIIVTTHADAIFGEHRLPTHGRLVVPLLLPKLRNAFPDGVESIHYSDNIAVTRATELKVITRHESPDTLITLEIPVVGTEEQIFPSNVTTFAHYNPRCYARQTPEGLELYNEYIARAEKLSGNILFCGRHARFKYFSMPETVEDAMNITENL